MSDLPIETMIIESITVELQSDSYYDVLRAVQDNPASPFTSRAEYIRHALAQQIQQKRPPVMDGKFRKDFKFTLRVTSAFKDTIRGFKNDAGYRSYSHLIEEAIRNYRVDTPTA